MGLPVVTVAAGGLPVVEATFGTPVTEATNGYGVPVTKVTGKPGLPVVFETIGAGTAPAGPPLDAYTTGLTAAWSMSRKLLTTYVGSFFTDTGGFVSTLFNQTAGANRNLTAGAGIRPAVATQGGIAVADFTPNVHELSNGIALSNFITASTGYMVFVVLIDTHAGAQGIIIRDTTVSVQLDVFTSTGQMRSYNDDGTGDVAAGTATAVAPPKICVMEWRHEGGSLFARLNGGTEVSVVSGNSLSMIGTISIGRVTSSGFDGKLYEGYIWSTVPSLADRNAIVAQAKAYVGIP